VLPNTPTPPPPPPLDTTQPPQLLNTLAHAPTVSVQCDGHVLPLQPLYDGSYTVLWRSLHHSTLQISDRTDNVSTLQPKPCSDHTAPPSQPRARGHPPNVGFRDFPPPGVAAACRVDFAPAHPEEPGREPFPSGQQPGGFAHPAAAPQPAAAQPSCGRRAPRPLSLQISGLKVWGEPYKGSINNDI
jgi:hypothetical protein